MTGPTGDSADRATGGGDPSGRPGARDAMRATVGVVAAFVVALLVGAFVAGLSDPGAPGFRSAGSTRAQLAAQAVVFALAALALVEALRLAAAPRLAGPLASPATARRTPLLVVLGVGATAAIGACLVGPIVGLALPNLADPRPPVRTLGIGSGVGPDVATVVVLVGLVPLGEELLFRGVLAGAWARAGRPGTATVLSALLFGLAHVTVGPRSVVVTLVLGALFAGALLLSGSLGAPVLAHAVVNAIGLGTAGLAGAPALVALVVTVVAVTLLAWRASPALPWRPSPAGTLRA